MKLAITFIVFAFLSNFASAVLDNCTASGDFPNTSDQTCKQYYTCVEIAENMYTRKDHICPLLTKFNPTTKACDAQAICIYSYCKNQLPLIKIPDPNAVNPEYGETYIQCTLTQEAVLERCPIGYVFLPAISDCVTI